MSWYSTRKMLKRKSNQADGSLFVFALDRLPLALIAGLAGFTVVAIILLLLEQFRTELIWTLGVVAALLCAWGVFRIKPIARPGGAKEWIICDIIVLVGVLVWGGWNFFLTSQHIQTDRDPATYAVTASWLSEHSSLRQQDTTIFIGVDGIQTGSAGFRMNTDKELLYPQGQHTFPALLGAIGKLVGPVLMLHFNVLFGMTALLAMYVFARLLLLSRWALAATAVVALSLPLLYFSRDTYTEPLTMTFTFGGLAMLWLVLKSRVWWAWVITGLLFGACLLVRIDAYLTLIGVMAFWVVYIALSDRKELKARLKEFSLFIVPVVALAVMAWLNLKLFSPGYYESHRPFMIKELLVLGGVVAIGVLATVVIAVKPRLKSWSDKVTKKWRGAAAVSVIVAAALFLALQPLWYKAPAVRQNSAIAEMQQAGGMEIEPRTYIELAAHWPGWYLGSVIVALGVLGLALATYKALRDKSFLLLAGVFVVLGTCLVYFWQPSITPDQIWASRRMLPVIMPGLVIFGFFAVAEIMRRLNFSSGYMKHGVFAAVTAGMIVAPLMVSAPFLQERFLKQHQLIAETCKHLPDDGVVVWLGMARLEMVQSTRTYCHVPAFGYHWKESDLPSKEKLAEIAKRARSEGKTPFIGSYSDQYQVLLDTASEANMTGVAGVEYTKMTQTLTRPPSTVKEIGQRVSLGIIREDGSIAKIPKLK